MIYINQAIRRIRAWMLRHVGKNRGTPRGLVKDQLVAEPWFVDSLSFGSPGTLQVWGWSFPQPGAAPTTFSFNGKPFDEMAYPLLRQEVGDQFWQRQDAAHCGFSGSGASALPMYPQGILDISRSSNATPIERGRDHWYFPDPALHGSVPDEDRRFRVIGNRDLAGFLNTGATDFYRLDSVTRVVTGQRIWELGPVLDWGVGCGRLARHWPRDYATSLFGCDIDHENASWCAHNLAGTFVKSDLRPPLPFDSGTFGLVYGISIFTHLKEELQFAWLGELQRVTKPGGWVLTTVHGETAIDFYRLDPHDYVQLAKRVAREGIVVGSANSQLDGHVDHQGEYVNVLHSRDYIQDRWSEYFDVVALIPGYIFTHDLVVLRKR